MVLQSPVTFYYKILDFGYPVKRKEKLRFPDYKGLLINQPDHIGKTT